MENRKFGLQKNENKFILQAKTENDKIYWTETLKNLKKTNGNQASGSCITETLVEKLTVVRFSLIDKNLFKISISSN